MAGFEDSASAVPAFKRCRQCGEFKSRDEFYPSTRHRDRLEHLCKTCIAVRNVRNYAKHGVKIRAGVSKYRLENLAIIRARKAKHQREHPEGNKRRIAKWKKTHPGYRSRWNAARRARKVGAESGDREKYRAFTQWAESDHPIPCYWCHKATQRGNRHRDHIIPLSRGGADAAENLCVSCPNCNLRKADKLPEEFRRYRSEA